MASYPTCVRCHGTESELDVDGVCTTCHSRGSGRETPGSGRRRLVNPAKTILDDETRTVPPFEANGVGTATIDVDHPVPLPILPPTVRFTHYTDLQYIDRGGMGLVYKAVQTNANRVVALKIMNPIAQSDSRQQKRFKTEAEALARLSHPGIVQIYDVGHENGVAYFSMEYVSGGPLSKRLKAGPKLSPHDAAELMAGVSSAIAAAHAVGVVHRDVKPSNILLNDIGMPKVTDFGLAALADSTARMTNTGALLGTPSYMSPEQASGRYDDVGPRSDVYSLGATLYELLTGKPPFVADTPVATAMKVCNDRLIRPREIEPKVPGDLEGICLKCLEKNPLDRYPSAAGLANELSRYLRGEPIGKPPARFRAARFLRKHRRTGLVSLALLPVFVLAAFVFTSKRPDPDKSQKPPEDPYSAIQNALSNGTPITLPLDAAGIPASYDWYSIPAKLGKTGPSEWGFQTKMQVYLELCRDTLTDRYEISGEINHLEATDDHAGYVGFFLCPHTPKPDLNRPSRFYLMTYRDWRRSFEDKIIDGHMGRKVHFATKLVANASPAWDELNLLKQYGYFFIDGLKPDQDHWRSFVISVRPEAITFSMFNNERDRVVREKTVSTETLAALDPDWQKEPAVAQNGGLTSIPPWSNRCRFGIYSAESSVSLRNIRITPLSP